MRIVWVTRSFLDYRIPVYSAISELASNNFYLVFGDEEHINPPRVVQKAKDIFGRRAVALKGEKCIGKPYNPAQASNSVYRYFYQPGLGRIIKSLKPDVIITDAFNHWTIPVFQIRMFSGIKHVMCYERTKHTERNAPWLKIFLRKQSFRWIDHIVCNGILCAEYVEWLGFSRSRISLGNMAADSTGLQVRITNIKQEEITALRTKNDICGPIFLYAGQLIPRKGIIELLSAWKEFSEKNPGPSLLLIGGGEQQKQVIEFVHNEKIEGVKILGNVDYSDMAGFYAMADIFIIATLEDNWSLVVPEAMSCGLPIICSKYNGCWPELVKPENGWVFDPLDHNNFINTLNEAWGKRSSWKSMGQQSLRIVQDFTPEKVAQNIYSACLKVTGTTD